MAKVKIEHRMRKDYRSMTGYGKAREIFNTMSKLKDADHNARFETKDLDGVMYIWNTTEDE